MYLGMVLESLLVHLATDSPLSPQHLLALSLPLYLSLSVYISTRTVVCLLYIKLRPSRLSPNDHLRDRLELDSMYSVRS